MAITSIDILKEAIEVQEAKAKDYQANGVQREDYFPFGVESYLQMIHIKVMRLRSTATNDSTNFESAKDSAVDLINYASFLAEYLEKQNELGDELSVDDRQDHQRRPDPSDAEWSRPIDIWGNPAD